MTTLPATEKPSGLALLRVPFPDHQISKLPRAFKKESPKGKCLPRRQGGDAPDHQDFFCGGYHGLPAFHIDYVGHAALTDRLLDCDPAWSWEPLCVDGNGMPILDKDGGMWIKLTVCGVTRLGYGDAQGKTGGDAMKERIGDALRNAAMRFGAALDLWHKGDLHVDEEKQPPEMTTAEALRAANVKPLAGEVNDPDGGLKLTAQLIQAALEKNLIDEAWKVYDGLPDADVKTDVRRLLTKEQRKVLKEHYDKICIAQIKRIPVAHDGSVHLGEIDIGDVRMHILAGELDLAADIARSIKDDIIRAEAEKEVMAAHAHQQRVASGK